jgi:hypothetical protein
MYVEKDLANTCTRLLNPMCYIILTMYVVRALIISLKWDYFLIKDLVVLVLRI